MLLLDRVEVAVFYFGHVDRYTFYPFSIFRFGSFFRLDGFVIGLFQFLSFAVEVFRFLNIQSEVIVVKVFFCYGFHLVDGDGFDFFFEVDDVRRIGSRIEKRG